MKGNLPILGILALILISTLLACQNQTNSQSPTLEIAITPSPTFPPTAIHPTLKVKNLELVKATIPVRPPASTTPKPTSTQLPEPSATATAKNTPSPTPIGACKDRVPAEDVLALITLDYGISRDFVPPDLVEIAGTMPVTVTLGYPTQVREIALEPLKVMIHDMLDAGLQPEIISGYRSYSSQAIAWNKWLEQVGDRASIVSAPPGHSEHQLGTTIDFGSPELALIVGDEDVEFHTYFYKTSESQWLEENAYKYGFTLSFTRETFDISGLYYEPWHYRYVGLEMARYLMDNNTTLIQHILENQEPPCIPDEK